MLRKLTIKNYALIEEAELEFDAGLNILTGETGAGKSILLGALGLALGERASGLVVRKGASRCEVSCLVDFPKGFSEPELKNLLKDSKNLEIRREVKAQGVSTAWLDGKPVSLTLLQKLGRALVEVHAQNTQMRLLLPSVQRGFLDESLTLSEDLKEMAKAHEVWMRLQNEKQATALSEEERVRRLDLLRHEVNEIEKANLSEGEEETLAQEVQRLANAEKLKTLSHEALFRLYEADGSAMETIAAAEKVLTQLSSLDSSIAESLKSLSQMRQGLSDVAQELARYRESVEFHPGRLDELMERQELLSRLKKRYGATLADVLASGVARKKELEVLEYHEEKTANLETELASARDRAFEIAKKLSQKRKKGAGDLSRRIERMMRELGLSKSRFDISVDEEDEISAHGKDAISFWICLNPGEEPQPLSRVASGGEISRILLAIRSVLSQAERTPSLIFDEVDSGVGGAMGNVIGEKLRELSRHHQILCVTHLPQLAAFASAHFTISKISANGRTHTKVVSLSPPERRRELARMLGGHEPTALKHAATLLEHIR